MPCNHNIENFHMVNSKRGFTLIELSIVLLIIGLISAGALVGRDLIHAAEIQKAIGQIQELQTALVAFKLKYNQLPGDMDNATNFWPDAINGDNNGKIQGTHDPDNEGFCVNRYEDLNVWHHLGQSQLVRETFPPFSNPGDFDLFPRSPLALDSLYINFAYDRTYSGSEPDNFLSLTTLKGPTSCQSLLGYIIAQAPVDEGWGMPPLDAQNIDHKLDNGLPLTGQIVTTFTSLGPGFKNCSLDDGSDFYNVTQSYRVCTPMIRMGL